MLVSKSSLQINYIWLSDRRVRRKAQGAALHKSPCRHYYLMAVSGIGPAHAVTKPSTGEAYCTNGKKQ